MGTNHDNKVDEEMEREMRRIMDGETVPEEHRGTIWALSYDGEGGFYFEGHSTKMAPPRWPLPKQPGMGPIIEEYGWFCIEFTEVEPRDVDEGVSSGAEQNVRDLLREAEVLGFTPAEVIAALLRGLHEAAD